MPENWKLYCIRENDHNRLDRTKIQKIKVAGLINLIFENTVSYVCISASEKLDDNVFYRKWNKIDICVPEMHLLVRRKTLSLNVRYKKH